MDSTSRAPLMRLAGVAWLVTVLVTGWPHVSLLSMAGPLALAGAGQSMLFAGLFRSVLADVPAHLGGIGSGALITLQRSGVALGVATLGTLYLALAPHSHPNAFAAVECVQMGVVALLAIGAAALPRFTKASADTPVIDGRAPDPAAARRSRRHDHTHTPPGPVPPPLPGGPRGSAGGSEEPAPLSR